MVKYNHIPNYGDTARPEAALENKQINKLAKLIDQVTLSRVMLVRLKERGVGIASVEREAERWELSESNAVGFQNLWEGEKVDNLRSTRSERRGNRSLSSGRKGTPTPRDPEKVGKLMELRIQQIRKKEKEIREEYKAEKVKVKIAFKARNKMNSF